MIRYHITDGSGRTESLLHQIERLVQARAVEWIQIREKTLPARALFELTVKAVAVAKPAGVRVLVNERADIALAAGADGVHLPSNSIPPFQYRSIGCAVVGVSCHNARELAEADQGADFAVLGPVFAPISKVGSALPPLGLDGFAQLVRGARIPVLALGGITWDNAQACMSAGASGVAGISLFCRD